MLIGKLGHIPTLAAVTEKAMRIDWRFIALLALRLGQRSFFISTRVGTYSSQIFLKFHAAIFSKSIATQSRLS